MSDRRMVCRFLTMLKLVAPPVSWWKVAAVGLPMTTTASASMGVEEPAV